VTVIRKKINQTKLLSLLRA